MEKRHEQWKAANRGEGLNEERVAQAYHVLVLEIRAVGQRLSRALLAERLQEEVMVSTDHHGLAVHPGAEQLSDPAVELAWPLVRLS